MIDVWENSISANKTRKIMNRNYLSNNGWIRADIRTELTSSISVITGILATLSLEHPSVWIKKLQMIPQEHLRILLKEIQVEVLALETFLEMILPGLPMPPDPTTDGPQKRSWRVISNVSDSKGENVNG